MDRTDIHERHPMRMRRMAGLLFAGGLAAGLGAGLQVSRCHGYASDGASQRWRFLGGRFHQVSNTKSGLCIGFPGDRSPVTAARLVLQECDEAPGGANCRGFGNAEQILELG